MTKHLLSMDPYQGIEVGAEVELNDGISAIEDYTSVKLENKQDLPLWHNLHSFDDSSSDESLDQQYAMSIPSQVISQEISKYFTDIRSQVVEKDQVEKNIYALSNIEVIQPSQMFINVEQREDIHSEDLQEKALATFLEDSRISCTEVISSSDLSQLYSTAVSSESISSSKENPNKNLSKYTYFDARRQCRKSVNPLGRSYKCQQCGRQFGRLYNLENHLCIKMAVGCSPQINNNIETMNRLEKMCAEAQKELQSLQGQYNQEVVGNPLSSLGIQTLSQELLSEDLIPAKKCTSSCNHHKLESKSMCNQEFYCDNYKDLASQNLSAFGNNIVVDLNNLSPIFSEAKKDQNSVRVEWASLNQHFETGQQSSIDTTYTSSETTKNYKCMECSKVYNKRCSITNHMRWHVKEKNMISSVVNAFVKQSVGQGQESFGTVPDDNTDLLGIRNVMCAKPSGTFTCEYCGKVFSKHCVYSTHTLWHMKNKEPLPVISTQGATNKGQSAGSLDDNIQSYHMLVRQLSLDEQHNLTLQEQVAKNSEDPHSLLLPMQIDPNEQRQPEVLESVFELVVGAEEVHEILVSNEDNVFQQVEHYDHAEEAVKAELSERKLDPEGKYVHRNNLDHGAKSKAEEKLLPSKVIAKRLSRSKFPHRCRDCGIRFYQSWHLKKHRLKDSTKGCTLKKHQCDCGRTPIGSLHFLLHQLQHLRDTAFNCAVCSKLLWGYRQLQAHSWVHPLVSQFQCNCGTRFTKLSKYLWHSLKNKAKPRPKVC